MVKRQIDESDAQPDIQGNIQEIARNVSPIDLVSLATPFNLKMRRV